jgi:hypothetical protein
LNESIRVSNAASQLAVPFRTTTFLGSSVNGSPKGSAAWTVAAGGAGEADGLATGPGVAAGAGVAEAAGAGTGEGLADGEAEGAGDCACKVPPDAMSAIGISAAMAKWKRLIRFILAFSIHPERSRRVPVLAAKRRYF